MDSNAEIGDSLLKELKKESLDTLRVESDGIIVIGWISGDSSTTNLQVVLESGANLSQQV